MSLSWNFPYASQRMPVFARNVVATSQPLAAQAGVSMMAKGGNAVDAALATAITLTVVEPTMNGIGSDAFCILWDGKELHGLNASGRAPKAWSPEYFSKYDTMPQRGWDAVTVPGCVSAWVALSKRFGKLPFADLFEPAIRYAHDGWIVPTLVGKGWESAVQTLGGSADFQAAFMPNGRAPKIGEVFKNEAQARTLARIAETNGEAFYQGDLAEKIAAHAKNTGGAMTQEDLATHQADWVTPISTNYRGYTLHEIPPNGQGIAALLTLGLLENLDMASHPVDSANSLHVQIEAMKLAYADAHRYVSDPATRDIEYEHLLDQAYLSERAKLIDMDKAQSPTFGKPGPSETIYLTAADESGMMVSFIQSNFMGFGSGVVVPDTGISLQNRGAGFTLEKGHPNQVGSGKRPYHTIIPAFTTKDGQPVMSYGVMGGAMQPQGHAQMMIRMFDYNQNPQTACDAPRWQVFDNQTVGIEPGIAPEVIDTLRARGHNVQIPNFMTPAYGGGQLIYKLENGYCAASEPRKDGQAVGF
ncbi:MAG: gamma-glutamyltranspeptidase/glutathione hydrolase [Candidatus Latescibacterota bacterium]|jgi:gamma-glutamyltranspeptidase/glutathione hydrolase